MNFNYKDYRDREYLFTIDDWDKGRPKEFDEAIASPFRCKPPLSLVVKGQINTRVFEEAIIEEYLIN